MIEKEDNFMADIENKEVTWKVYGIDIHGTITAPADQNTHPAVILVAGSGPTDRDWCSPLLPGTNGSGKLLAEALAEQGYITLRYDKVASGPHVRENVPKLIGKISMQSHLEELKGAVETLLAEKAVDKNNLFALTNSEGAIHAVNYQLQAKSNRFKGLVLTGAPGRAIGDISRTQIQNQVKQLPNAEAIMKVYDEAIAEFLVGKPMTKEMPIENLKFLLMSLYSPMNLPFARELWNYSLPEYLAKVDEPVLIVIGKKDIQVDWKLDGAELEKLAAAKRAVSIVYPENANHVLKHEVNPIEQINAQAATLNYNAPEEVLDKDTATAILDWFSKQV
jgi:pimeloyl-ACP methyl ester carboxylesterase